MPLLHKLVKMLKPNGWIQWTEQDLRTCHVVSAFANVETKYTEDLKSFALAPTPQWPIEYVRRDLNPTRTPYSL